MNASCRRAAAALVNFSVDAIVLVTAGGVIQWANPATTDVLGLSRRDIAGVHVRDLVEPADREAWQALVAELFDDPAAPVRGTFRCRHKDGSVRWTEGVARNLLQNRASAPLSSTSATSRLAKRPKRQLKASEDRYGHLVSSAADMIFEADAEGYFRFVNPQTLRCSNIAQDEVIGRRFTEFIRADYRPQILQHYYPQTIERPAELVHRVSGDYRSRAGKSGSARTRG